MNIDVKNQLVNRIVHQMSTVLDGTQLSMLEHLLRDELRFVEIEPDPNSLSTHVDITADLIQMFIASLKVAGRKDGTIKQYCCSIKRLLTYLNKPVTQINRNDVRSYLFFITSRMSAQSVCNQLANIRPFFEWLRDEEYILHNPCKGIAAIKVPPKPIETLSAEEILKMEEASYDFRSRAILAFLLSTGLRCGEMVNVLISDVNFDRREVRLISEKSGKPRVVPLTPRAVNEVMNYLNSRTDDDPHLFVSLRRKRNENDELVHVPITRDAAEDVVKKIGKRAKVHIPNTTVHVFRRTLGTNLINSGCPVEVVQKILGHRSPETTLKYYASVSDKYISESYDKYIHNV